MPKKYQIKPLFLLVQDKAGTKFHVKNDDYFGTIATILNLLKQEIKKNGPLNSAIFKKTLNSLEKDLLFLQKNYQISPKIKNKNKIPEGKLINQ
ncbi:MAG: hypothetical protein ACYC40_01475 [Patescibacteria group bacterium]